MILTLTLIRITCTKYHAPQGALKGAQDAAYVYEELIDKFGGSPLLLNGLAIAKMHQGQYAEAETSLQQALTKVTYTLVQTLLFTRFVFLSHFHASIIFFFLFLFLFLFLSLSPFIPPLSFSLLSSHYISLMLILLFILSILFSCQHSQAPSDPDSLANLIVVSQHLQRAPEIVNRYIR